MSIPYTLGNISDWFTCSSTCGPVGVAPSIAYTMNEYSFCYILVESASMILDLSHFNNLCYNGNTHLAHRFFNLADGKLSWIILFE